jgi:lysophospholipase L1-like esterase
VAELIPVGDNGPEDAFVVKFNGLITTAVVAPRQNAGQHVYLVDQHTGFDPKTMFPSKPDPIHPNQAGYEHMGDVWYAAIKSVLP